MNLQEYINQVNKRYQSGISKEHSYRSDLENLIRTLIHHIEITNEPANVTDCGNPDYIITKGKIPIGYIEAKDIGKDLNSKQYQEQFQRYRKALDNLIITDYLWFQFFQNNQLTNETRIAEIHNGKVIAVPENFDLFVNLITEFCTFIGQTIKSAQKLAVLMASKARLLENILENAVTSDEKTEENTSLKGQLKAFREILIHDITPKGFADIYAQTLAYGMFAARLHDPTIENFSRQEAAELIPKSNPFLRKLFQYIAGYDIDERIKPTVNNLADLFRVADLKAVMQNFGKSTGQDDPVIHFYETFLAEYDPKLRKSRGVWYTPEPVVNFIVRAVDDILKTEFGLPQGLADNSKIKIKVDTHTIDKRSKTGYKQVEEEVHRVQILDPATGTGTFLAEIVKHIYNSRFKAMQGIWSSYVENDLIPRLNGFELLMASYAMAHLKLDLLLQETGYQPKNSERFRIFLTNSLEEYHPDTGTLFAQWLSTEANEANHVKRDTPVMVVLGNPPYSVNSSNKGEWIEKLMQDYKRDLKEKNIQPLSDDYIKFIRYGEYFVGKNGEGILAYISNNSFIDGVTHRQMRKHLLETFDKIYILDLHGNAKKKETVSDGSKDENVFDIQQGVSINLFVKNNNKKKGKLAMVLHSDLFGLRELKYTQLFEKSINFLKWNNINYQEPYYFFVKKEFELENDYKKCFQINKAFNLYNTGIETGRDSFFIDFENELLKHKVQQVYSNLSNNFILNKYNIKDNSNFRFKENLVKTTFDKSKVRAILYRPFDIRFTYYDHIIQRRPSYEISKNLYFKNYALISCRQQSSFNFQHAFISKILTERCSVSLQTKETGYIFPLYLYRETTNQQTIIEPQTRTPNLNKEIVQQIAEKLNLTFTDEKEPTEGTFAPIDLLDYIYAVLHSPTYREQYKEFLKIDFPRVPYPEDQKTFWQLVTLGGELRQLHLLESPKVEQFITTYPKDGDNTITRRIAKKDWELYDTDNNFGRVWINDNQYFDHVPLVAWEFYIGGYQPAQKWLKDRHGRVLSFDDILHYQKIIVALTETERIMKDIDATWTPG